MRLLPITFLPALALAVATSGCLTPVRDNDLDPANRPQVSLVVVDHEDDSGACSTNFADGVDWISVGTTRRSACLALDARATTDPQGDAPDSLDYVFGLLDTAGAFHAFSSLDIARPRDSVAILDSSFLRTFSQGIVNFAVRATDDTGATGEGRATILFVNSRPVAHPGRPRILPIGGHPWAPGVDFSVTFDPAASSDEEHDLLRYCWTFPDDPGPAVCSTNAADPAFTRTVECSEYSRYLAKLVVDDGDLESLPVIASAQVGEPDLFVSPSWYIGATEFVRVEPRRLEVTLGSGGGGEQAEAVPRAAAAMAVISATELPGPTTQFHLSVVDLDGTSGASVLIAEQAGFGKPIARFAIEPDGARIHVLSRDPGSGYRHRLFDLAPDSLELVPAQPPLAITAEFGHPQTGLVADEAGALWFSDVDGLIRIPPQGAAPQRMDTELLAALVRRPAPSTEIWTLSNYEGIVARLDTANPSSPALVVDSTLPGLGGLSYPASSIGFSDTDTIWMVFQGDALRLLDIEQLLAGAGVESATITKYPLPAQAFLTFVDPQTGTAYLEAPNEDNGLAELLAVSPSGASERQDYGLEGTTYPEFPQAIDASGRIWFQQNGGAVDYELGRYSNGVSGSRMLLGNSWASIPDGEGGLWAALYVGAIPTLVHHGADGTLLGAIQTIDDSVQGEIPLPADTEMGPLRGSPDGEYFWTSGPSEPADAVFHRIDLSTGERVEVLAGVEAADRFTSGIFEPSAPIPGTTPFLWTLDAPTNQLSTVSLDGTIADKGTPLTGSVGMNLQASMSYVDNELCVVHEDASIFRSRRVTPAGAESILGAIPRLNAPNAYSFAVAASSTICWVSVCESASFTNMGPCDLRLQGWNGAGTVVHSFTGVAPERIFTIAPADDERVFFTWYDGEGSRLGRIDFTAGVTTGGVMTLLPATTLGGGLVDPRSSRSDDSP